MVAPLGSAGIADASSSVALQYREGPYLFKRAQTDDELAQVHRLNYLTFVREIPQHHDPGNERLIDKFHHKNLYIIAKRGDEIVGMLAVHDQAPFSVADRLRDRDVLARLGGPLLEVRLLAIKPDERHKSVIVGLLWATYRYAVAAGYSHLIASGLQERVPLYRRFGFRALGRATQSGDAWFVPMCLSLRKPAAYVKQMAVRWERRVGLLPLAKNAQRISLLPGPAQLAAPVRAALAAAPVSHRSPAFVLQFEECREILRTLVGGHEVAMLCGSGTLANDVVAVALARRFGARPGLVLNNGEFGARLVDQAERVGLRFDVCSAPWGRAWDLDAVERALADGAAWVWAVHSESSTGVLNPVTELQALCDARGVEVCLDCISSLGAAPLHLGRTLLATGASGKALGGVAGLAFVFARPGTDWAATSDCFSRGAAPASSQRDVNIADCCPTTFDLAAALQTRGPRFTFPSPIVGALRAALAEYATPQRTAQRFAAYAELGAWIRARLADFAVVPLAERSSASPVLTTFAPPRGYAPEEFGLLCRACGYEVNTVSPYLAPRGLVQIATMGALTPADCEPLFERLAAWLRRSA